MRRIVDHLGRTGRKAQNIAVADLRNLPDASRSFPFPLKACGVDRMSKRSSTNSTPAARNRAAIHEHLAVIQACLSGQKADAIQALEAHLKTARRTMMASVNWD